MAVQQLIIVIIIMEKKWTECPTYTIAAEQRRSEWKRWEDGKLEIIWVIKSVLEETVINSLCFCACKSGNERRGGGI